MKVNRRTTCKLLVAAPTLLSGWTADAAPDSDNAAGSGRPWLGPDYWSNALQDWRLQNGRMECVTSGFDRNIYLLTKELSNAPADFSMSVILGPLEKESKALNEGFVGFRLGIDSEQNDYRSNAIYGSGMNAGIDANGGLFIGEKSSSGSRIAGFPTSILSGVQLRLEARSLPEGYRLRLSALDPTGKPLAQISREKIMPADLQGGLALVCSSGPVGTGKQPPIHPTDSGPVVPLREYGGNWRFWFKNWQVSGPKTAAHPDRAFGPILWTMYTFSRGVLKLSAQMAPMGNDAEPVRLEVHRQGKWVPVGSAAIDRLARNVTFRITSWDAANDVDYRVVHRLDRDYTFEGTIKKDPVAKPKIVVAALSCLNDFGFPHTDLLASIQHFQPDLVAFQGDQIYERSGSYGIQRSPVEPAVLDFLRKWYLFGWAFRDVMRSTPTICQTDDHDMYQGNIWGAAGRHAEGTGKPGQDSGGYVEPATWVNTVQRCQTSHLPDPFDATPVEQGIGVYYTDLVYGGVSFAILEDRKWKSAPKILLPKAQIVNGWAQNPEYNAASDGDVPDAELFGSRQLKFLDQWARNWQGGVWMKIALTQTLLANLATLPPPANNDDVEPDLPILKPGQYSEGEVLTADHDSNAWPQTGRNLAIEAFRRCAALHVCGDQHLGSTMQYGVQDFNDAVFAFCSPALSNYWPRRWFPPHSGKNPLPAFPRSSGEYVDGFGNKMTVHAFFNPQQVAPEPNPLMDRSPGIGIIELHRDTRAITMSLWPRRESPTNPAAGPAHGWPVHIQQLDNGWSSCQWMLPAVRLQNRRDFCVEVHEEKSGDWLYTLRIKGNEFRAPVRREGTYAVRVFDPDSRQEQLHQGLAAVRKT